MSIADAIDDAVKDAEPLTEEVRAKSEVEPAVGFEVARERARRAARRIVDAEELADGSGEAPVRTFAEEAALPVPEDQWSINGLLPDEGRAVFAGYRKAGKTTAVLNLAAAWADTHGGIFLGEFRCEPPKGKVVWLNLELTEKQARRWVQRLALDPENGTQHRRRASSRSGLQVRTDVRSRVRRPGQTIERQQL